MEKPNIILITIDTLRADMLTSDLMPNLKRLATEGFNFTQAVTGGSWTQAAFPTIMTSTFASMYGGCLGYLSPERPSPIQSLSQNGYQTAGFSTSPLLSKTYGYNRGFNHFIDAVPVEKNPPFRYVKGGQKLLSMPMTHHLANMFGQDWRPPRLYNTAEELNNMVCQWLDRTEESFFAWVHYMDVHWPYHLEEKLRQPSEIAQAWSDVVHLHEVNFNGAMISEAQKEYYKQLYIDAVRYTDNQVGHLVDYLEKNGRLENTIIMIVSDHGEEFLERRHWGHVEINLYDEILKVPFIIWSAKVSEGQEVFQQVSTMDIMPTVLDLCDVPVSEEMLGQSLTKLWQDDEQYTASVAIGERWREDSHIIAIRAYPHKLIWNSEQPSKPMLFNLENDPSERNDIWEQSPDIVADLMKEVEAHLQRMNETMPDSASSEPDLDDEMLDRLRGLGYLE